MCIQDNGAACSGQSTEEQESVLAALPRQAFCGHGEDVWTKGTQGIKTPPHSPRFYLGTRNLFNLSLRVAPKQSIARAAGFTA